MPAPQVPKYQAIYNLLRRRILDGELVPGERLSSQAVLADSFGVTLMTLRQAIAALEVDGLIRTVRGRGTFVTDNPVDINLGNLSSFAQQMRLAGVALTSKIFDVATMAADSHPSSAVALGIQGDIQRITRLRLVQGEPFALQRSYLDPTIDVLPGGSTSARVKEQSSLINDSLYDSIEAATGWTVAMATETITAVGLVASDAELLEVEVAQPALLSIRVSFNQFDQPFLYDEALLAGERCTMSADRTSDRLSLRYLVSSTGSP